MVKELEKISVSVPSISRDVLHNVHIEYLNREKMLELFCNDIYMTIYETIVPLK